MTALHRGISAYFGTNQDYEVCLLDFAPYMVNVPGVHAATESGVYACLQELHHPCIPG